MSESEAVVARIDGDDVWLQVCGNAACEECESSQGCGLGGHREPKLQRFRNTVGARVGDTVIVSVPEGAVLKAAFLSYLLPLAVAVAAAALGTAVGGDRGAVAGVLLGLVAGWLLLRRFGDRLAQRRAPLVSMRLKRDFVHVHRNGES